MTSDKTRKGEEPSEASGEPPTGNQTENARRPAQKAAPPTEDTGDKKLLFWAGVVIFYLVSSISLAFYVLFVAWPPGEGDPEIIQTWQSGLGSGLWGQGMVRALTNAQRMFLIVLAAGSAGACIHAIQSIGAFVGNRRVKLRWLPWYLLRPFIGMGLALLVYLAFRGGLTGGGSEDIDPYGVAALAGLAGMFSKVASDKLEEVFSTMFSREKEVKYDDSLAPEEKSAPRRGDEAGRPRGYTKGNRVVATQDIDDSIKKDALGTVVEDSGPDADTVEVTFEGPPEVSLKVPRQSIELQT